MGALLKKLNHPEGERVVLMGRPADVEVTGGDVASVEADGPDALPAPEGVRFVVAFVQTLEAVSAVAAWAATLTDPDPVVWLAYPKQTSRRYRCAFNRDTGWSALGAAGYEPVRQVAIDADWSALRFRKVERIGKMTRSFAMTEEGRAKVAAARSEG